MSTPGEGGFALANSAELFEKLGPLDKTLNIARLSSLWYMLFATACCGIELMQTGGPRTDLDRFGMVFRATPRQSDLMMFAGTITYKMAVVARRLYDQMSEPKYVLAMGSCANCGGLFVPSYSVVKGIDLFVPVDVYIPGCPPRPEALAEGMLRIQDIMRKERWSILGGEGKQGPARSHTDPQGGARHG
jgi:NADH-quinone oxidoreductase subunit B